MFSEFKLSDITLNMEVISNPINSVDTTLSAVDIALQQANDVALKLANSVDTALQALSTDTGVNLNSLEAVFVIRCEIRDHEPTTGGMGMFCLRGSRLLPTSLRLLTDKPETFLGQEGCGYDGCTSSATNSLQELLHELPAMVPCSNKAFEHDVPLIDACDDHQEVSSGTLVLNLCKELTKWLASRFRSKFNSGFGLPHHTLIGLGVSDSNPGKEVFGISVRSAMQWAISTQGSAALVANDYIQYPYLSTLVTDLLEGGVAESDSVRTASLSQQHLVTKRIHQANDQAKTGNSTKRRREEVEINHLMVKKLKTSGQYFPTKTNRVVDAGEFNSPVHTIPRSIARHCGRMC